MRLYTNKVHEVVSMAINNLRSARMWEAEALGAEELNNHNYYGIDYAMRKSDELWDIAKRQYIISGDMRKASPERVEALYRRAEALDMEALKIENR